MKKFLYYTWSTPIGMGMGVRSTLYHVRIYDFAEYLSLSEIFFLGAHVDRSHGLVYTPNPIWYITTLWIHS